MVRDQEVRDVANAKASEILLEGYEVHVTEEAKNWVYAYIPKGRVRGDGFMITISKDQHQVVRVMRNQ